MRINDPGRCRGLAPLPDEGINEREGMVNSRNPCKSWGWELTINDNYPKCTITSCFPLVSRYMQNPLIIVTSLLPKKVSA